MAVMPRMIMRTAMWTLYTGPSLEMLRHFAQLETGFGSEDPSILSQSRLVWTAMVKLSLDGLVEVTGHFKASPISQLVEPGLLVTSHPNFQKHTLNTDAGMFYGVLVQALESFNPPPSNPTSSRSGYQVSDQALVSEMFAMVDQGMAPFAAATELAPRAKGGGMVESKAKRLHTRFTQLRSFTQN